MEIDDVRVLELSQNKGLLHHILDIERCARRSLTEHLDGAFVPDPLLVSVAQKHEGFGAFADDLAHLVLL